MMTKIKLALFSFVSVLLLGFMLAVSAFTMAGSNAGRTFAFDGTTINLAQGDCGSSGGGGCAI